MAQSSGWIDPDDFWCVRCLRRYHSKQRFLEHFLQRYFIRANEDEESEVRENATEAVNPCYGLTKGREFGKSLKEALTMKKQLEEGSLLKFVRNTVASLGQSLMTTDLSGSSDADDGAWSETVIENPLVSGE